MKMYRSLVMMNDPVKYLYALERNGSLENKFPELAALRMVIPAGYRHKDNLKHSIQVLERAIRFDKNNDPVLRVAALLHDIGKPATRKFHGKGVVTFRNHENVGARMARKMLKRDGENNQFINEVTSLIRLHMRAYGFSDTIWTDSAVRRLMTDAGSPKQLERLLVLFKSDLTTGSGQKREKISRGIDSLGEAFQRVKNIDERASLRPALNGNDVMELTGLKPGRELGRIMKFLNSDNMVRLSKDETLVVLRKNFPELF